MPIYSASIARFSARTFYSSKYCRLHQIKNTLHQKKMVVQQQVQFLLDRSGSMHGKTADVIGGLKSNLENLPKESFVSIKLFNEREKMVLEPTQVVHLTEDKINESLVDYIPSGQTAIIDTLLSSLEYFRNLYTQEAFTDCIIYVMTDGQENASICSQETRQQLPSIITKAEDDYKIKVVYVGSNQDAIVSAARLGIRQDLAMDFSDTNADSAETVKHTFKAMTQVAFRSLSGDAIGFTKQERIMSQSGDPISTSANMLPNAAYRSLVNLHKN